MAACPFMVPSSSTRSESGAHSSSEGEVMNLFNFWLPLFAGAAIVVVSLLYFNRRG